MQTRSNAYFIFLTLLLVVEMGFFTFWRKDFDPHTLPVLFLGIQLLIGILPLFLSKKSSTSIKNNMFLLKIGRLIPLSIAAILGVWLSFNMLNDLYKNIAINPSYSDIIPQVQKFCRQALAGQFPYTPFDDFGYRMPPTYLPSQWMPYLPSEIFKFDPRFITFWVFALTYMVFSIKIIKSGISLWASFILMALPVLLISVVHDHDQGVWSITVEQLIMCYYLLLGISLTTNSRIFQIITVVLCLMSRFSLLFWLPLYAFMLWTKEGWRPTLKFGLWVFIGCALLYVPFLLKDPYIFLNAQAYYDLASIGEWERSDKPVHLYNGLGFAIYFFEKGGDMAMQIASLKKYLFVITPSVSVLLGLIWWRFKDKLDFGLFAICSLKISLAVFYALIQIPYSYLYVTPIIISLAVLYKFAYLLKTDTEKPVLYKADEKNSFLKNTFSKLSTRKFDYSPYIVLILAFLFFILKFDISVLDFTHTNWVYRLSFDPGSELIGWNYYRNTPWSFPIVGRMEGFDYPTVTGVGMTQMVALLAVLFKTISAWLPNEFQYFGLWYMLCFLLQGWFGLKLIRNICEIYNITPPLVNVGFRMSDVGIPPTSDVRSQKFLIVLAALFFIIAPIFLFRTGHIVLFSHFYILAALSLYFSKATPQKKYSYMLLLIATAAGVSQYMTVMAMSVMGASFLNMWWRKIIPFYKVLLYSLGLVLTAFLVFYMMGDTLIPFDNYQTYGFGVFSSNLNTFFNPQLHSTFLPELPVSNPSQYEGFGYLGLGFILLLIFVMGYWVSVIGYWLLVKNKTDIALKTSTQPTKLLSPLIVVMVLFFLYALSNKIGWNDKVIFEWQYGSVAAALFETLRGSGRFIWIPFYGIMVLVFIGFFKMKLSPIWKTALLSTCLVIQILDTQKLMTLDKDIFTRCTTEECSYLKWRPLFREASRVVMFPLYSWDFRKTNDFYPFCRAASEENKAITTGYFARRHTALVNEYETQCYAEWEMGRLGENDKAIFVGKKQKLWRFQKLVSSGQLQCFEYDGYAVLVPPVLKNTLAHIALLPDCRPLAFTSENVSDFLEKHTNNTVFVTVSEEATFKLDSQTRQAFQKTQAPEFEKLGFAGSYMSIIHKGKTLFEQVAGQGENVEKIWEKGNLLMEHPDKVGRGGNRVLNISKKLQLTSRGDVAHKMSKTLIDGKEYSPYHRGLNFVVVNDKFEVIEASYFDTFEETYHAVFK